MKPYLTPEQFAALNRTNMDAAMHFARLSMQTAERLMSLQLEAARSAVEDGARQAHELAQVSDAQQALELRRRFAAEAVDKALDYSRQVCKLASDTQGEVARLMEDRMSTYHREMSAAVEELAKHAPAGSEAVIGTLRQAMGTTSTALETMTKAARQMAEMAEASVKAAADAAAGAVRGAKSKD